MSDGPIPLYGLLPSVVSRQWVVMGPYTVTSETGAGVSIPWPLSECKNIHTSLTAKDSTGDWSSVQLVEFSDNTFAYWGVQTQETTTFKALIAGLFYNP